MPKKPLVIFTDLDGSLLDHNTYSHEAANDAMRIIEERKIPLIFNTSKTLAELLELRFRLNNKHPFVIENGSAVVIPPDYFEEVYTTWPQKVESIQGYQVIHFGLTYSQLLLKIHSIRNQLKFPFIGFSDMDVAGVQQHTGLSVHDAKLAKQRLCSEPILWQGSSVLFDQFQRCLVNEGLRVLKGGRFYHILGPVDKRMGVYWLKDHYHEQYYKSPVTTVSLGDGNNDRGMLEATDYAVVIPPENGIPLELSHFNQVIYATKKGPAGWQQGLEQIFGKTGIS
jgi:mannosyl-3-phosphoglycerate phosphatase